MFVSGARQESIQERWVQISQISATIAQQVHTPRSLALLSKECACPVDLERFLIPLVHHPSQPGFYALEAPSLHYLAPHLEKHV